MKVLLMVKLSLRFYRGPKFESGLIFQKYLQPMNALDKGFHILQVNVLLKERNPLQKFHFRWK
jgi:hypothetical protein